MPRRCSSVAGVVMLFHSPMSRMNRTLPEAVDGESEPKTASWRAHHGRHDEHEHGDAADGGADAGSPGGRAPCRPPRAPAVPGERRARATARTSRPSLRDSVARPGEQAGRGERAPGPLEAAGRHPQRPDDQRLVEREVVGLDQVDRRQERDRDEDARRRRRTQRAGAGVARDRPGQRAPPARRSARRARPRPTPRSRRPRGTAPGRSTRAASSARSTGSAGSDRPGSRRRPRRRSR